MQAGLSLSQIGEFSFIIATLGLTLKVTSDFLYPIAVAVSAITTFTTPFLIRVAEPVYGWLAGRLPDKWSHFLDNYSSGAQAISHASNWQLVLRSFAQIILSNSIIIISLILLTTNFLLPVMRSYFPYSIWGKAMTAVLTLALMAPFIWALAIKKISNRAYSVLWRQKHYSRGPLVALELARIALAVFFVSFLLDQLFSVLVALGVALVLIIVVVPLFAQGLRKTYDRIEHRFLANLNAREREQASSVERLLPWEAHLAQFNVHPNAVSAGKTLEELALRERFGVSIAQIERGQQNIPVPRGQEQLFPGDRITVIGTDELLSHFRPEIEALVATAEPPAQQPEVSMKQVLVDSHFPFLGISIRDSGIREKTNGLIVGLERDGQRILNPDPATVFQKGDIVWLAGDSRLIRTL